MKEACIIFLYFLNVVLHMSLYCSFCMLPLKNHYRYSTKVTIALSVLVIIIIGLLDILFFEKGSPLVAWQNIVPIFALAFVVAYGALMIKGHYFQLVFIVIVCFCFHASMTILSKIIAFSYPMPTLISWFPAFNDLLTQFLIMLVFIAPMMYMSYKLFAKVIDNGIDFLEWRYTVVLPLAIFAVYQLYISFFLNKLSAGYIEIIMILFITFASYFAYMSVIKVLLVSDEKHYIAETQKITSKQLEFQKLNYGRLNDYLNETARERHDFRHHYLAIRELVNSGDMEKAKRYLKQFDNSYPTDELFSICENSAIDTILKHYIVVAKSNDAQVTTNVVIPNDIGVEDSELCVIIGNIVENGVEATQRQHRGKKFLDIKASIVGQQLIIIVANSYEGEIKEICGNFLSSKAANRLGIGVDSVKKMVTKIGGDVDISYKEGQFKIAVIVNLQR